MRIIEIQHSKKEINLMNNIATPNVTLNNGILMPQLGLGVWQAKDGQEVKQAVLDAISAGYRLIDTAAVYGNEAGVGEAIKECGVPREELFVTTKLWNADQGDYETVNKAFTASLEKLGLDYVDLYLIHWPVPARGKYIETWQALEKIYADGRAKAIGVCNFKPHHLEELLKNAKVVPVVNQIELHPRFPQKETRDFCAAHDIFVESWSPIGGSGAGWNNSGEELKLLDEPLLMLIGNKYAKSPAQVVIRWHLQNELIVIPKSVHKERIIENLNVFDFELDEDDMRAIDELETGKRVGADPDSANFV